MPANRSTATAPADIPTRAFDALLLAATPLLDLRAPTEFARGSLPAAAHHPLLEDDERAQVGVCFHDEGEAAALALGHRLVSGGMRQRRMEQWVAWCDAHPTGVLYCLRGGHRSRIVQGWLAAAGRPRAVLAGGYKAMRAHLSARLAQLGASVALIVIGGRTGSGKTAILESLPRHLDLEGLARHRGSAFGGRIGGQPSLADFENRLACELLRLTHTSTRACAPRRVAIEDESQNVGRLTVPRPLHANLLRSDVVLVEMPLEQRVATTMRAYVLDACRELQQVYGEKAGFDAFAAQMTGGLDRIRKRLGLARHEELRRRLDEALRRHRVGGEVDAHRAWIEKLLVDYYDPKYDYQLAARNERIVFRGDADEVREWVLDRS